MKILVRAPNWIGDQVMAYPFFRYLRAAYPKAEITVACVPWVRDIQFSGFVDRVVSLRRAKSRSLHHRVQAILESANEVRAFGPYDLALSLPNSFSAGLFVWRAGAKRRRGYAADARSLLLNERVTFDPDPRRHRAQAYFDLLPDEIRPNRDICSYWQPPRFEGESDFEADPFEEDERERSFEPELHWPRSQPIEPPTNAYWVLAPGATADSRRWPLESFVQLARTIHKSTGWKGLIVGGPAEAPAGDYLAKDPELGLEDFTARGKVSGLWRLFQGAQLTVTNESGLAHVASLCGSPVQIICGAADPRRTQPLGPGQVRVAVNAVDCWPCERNVCYQEGDQKLKCLRGIAPDTVWEEWQVGTHP